jgi:hypothetical protein
LRQRLSGKSAAPKGAQVKDEVCLLGYKSQRRHTVKLNVISSPLPAASNCIFIRPIKAVVSVHTRWCVQGLSSTDEGENVQQKLYGERTQELSSSMSNSAMQERL